MGMNKQKPESEGGIGWCERTWNPIKGMCPHDCKDPQGESYCYARAIYKRFKLDPTIRLDKKTLNCGMPKKPSRIFVCSTIDIFAKEIPDEWIKRIIDVAKKNPQHVFQFLTKKPGRYVKFRFPENCWLGTTWDGLPFTKRSATDLIWGADMDRTRFISFEPLLSEPTSGVLYANKYLHWIIIGADSRRGAKKPPREWADMLIEAAREYNVPVWVKSNYG